MIDELEAGHACFRAAAKGIAVACLLVYFSTKVNTLITHAISIYRYHLRWLKANGHNISCDD